MTSLRFFTAAAGVVVALGGLATPAAAQTNDETFQNLQWNFSTPGARANGMGKTFIGKADDASAAVTNPAGLMSLSRPQVYAEFKMTRLSADRLATANSLTSLQPTTTTTDINSLSFVSVSVPIKSRLAVAFSLHRFLDYEEQFSLAPRAIPRSTDTFFPVNGTVDFAATAYGGSLAYMVTNRLRLGVTVAANQLEADSVLTRTDFTGTATATNIIANQVSINDSQMATSVTVGGMYRTTSDKVTVGFSYTKSPRFNTEENLKTNPGYRGSPASNLPLVQRTGFPKPVEINVPDHFGFGVAVRPISKLLVAFDVVQTQYSSLSENTTIIFDEATIRPTDFDTPDTTEVHIGAEYMLGNIMSKPLLLRAGVFTNPNHLTSYTGSDVTEQAFYRFAKKDDTRATVGAGVVLGARTQIDAAYIIGREFVASAAVRF